MQETTKGKETEVNYLDFRRKGILKKKAIPFILEKICPIARGLDFDRIQPMVR